MKFKRGIVVLMAVVLVALLVPLTSPKASSVATPVVTEQPWTPTLSASGTQPVLGSGGYAKGSYWDLRPIGVDLIYATYEINFGEAGFNRGSGEYIITYPVEAATAAGIPLGGGFVWRGIPASEQVLTQSVSYTSQVFVPSITGPGVHHNNVHPTIGAENPWTMPQGGVLGGNLWFQPTR